MSEPTPITESVREALYEGMTKHLYVMWQEGRISDDERRAQLDAYETELWGEA